MRRTRVFIPEPLQIGTECRLPESAVRHVVRALRLQPGDLLTVFDGRGGEYDATLVRSARNEAWIQVETFREREAESALAITLIQGISRGERMDYAIQKAVELGVHSIVPVFNERSVVQLQGDRADRRQAHWQGVAQSACEQCGRNRVPELHMPMSFAEWLDTWNGRDQGLALSPTAQRCLAELPEPEQPITVLIGPEGGLTDKELRLACSRGFDTVRLGPRVLRTETAALAALAAMQTLWGDF